MTAEVDGPVEMTSSRRRGSTIGSTGLDYSSCHRVDEDIVFRIRSLLLSRNERRPPRTPCPSDEHNHPCIDLEDTVAGFDFSTAKSVARIARQETSRLSTPDIGKFSKTNLEMEPGKAPRPSLPGIKLTQPPVRKSSSASDLRIQVDTDHNVQSPTNPDANQDLPGETKPRFKLPKLVLQDKRKVGRKVKSCIEISPPTSDDDLKIHETELLCCPPCDPDDFPKSKYTTNYTRWSGGKARPMSGDIACFLAGCPPSHLECKKHDLRQFQHPKNSITDHRLAEDFKGVAEGLAQDIARMGQSLKEVKLWSKTKLDEQKTSKPIIDRRAGDFGIDGGKSVAPSITVNPPASISGEASESEICSSVTLTSDAFPHASQSMELVANETIPHRLSTTVSTNFSLPGYKARRGYQVIPPPAKQETRQPAPPIDTNPALSVAISAPDRSPSDISLRHNVRTNEAEIPPVSQSKPQSLFSGGSKRSASARHALLKPSVTQAQPVDTGLPIPAVLSPISSISETSMPEMHAYYGISHGAPLTDFARGQNQANVGSSSDGPSLQPQIGTGPEVSQSEGVTLGDVQATTASPVVGHVTTVQNAEDLVHNIQSRVEGIRTDIALQERSQSPPPVMVKSKAAVGAPRVVAESSQSPTPDRNPTWAAQALTTVSESDSLNAAYWGFVPQVKEAVQDAVQVAVRNAVRENTVPPGVEKDKASKAYRKVVASTLVEAAKNADDYLRRSSLWNEPPSSARGCSESTVIRAPGEERQYSASAAGECPCDKARQPSVASKENVESCCSQQPNLSMSVDEIDPVPLEKAEKPKSRKKRARPFRNGSRFVYEAIPTRDSSKNRILSTKTSATNMPPKRSYERLVTRVQLRSISSEASLKQDRAGEQLLLSSKNTDRRKIATSVSLEEIDGRQNTVAWLKGLLTNNGSYEPRFTALPPRTLRGPSRSQTAPVTTADELYLEVNVDPTKVDRWYPKGQVSKRDAIADPSEKFTRTVDDLENLMNEALVIARQATDNQDTQFAPTLLGTAAKVLKAQRDRYQAKLSGIRDSEEAPSIHESLRSLSDSEMSYLSDDAELCVEATEQQSKNITMSFQKPLKNPAGWPPNGRTTTPYPPASMPPSNESRSPPMDMEYPTTADPRPLPTEADFQGPRKISKPVGVMDTVDDEDRNDEPVPEFRNPEPFSNPSSREATRKISAKSPKRLSPTRQTQSGLQPDRSDYEDIPLPKLTPRNTEPSRRCVEDTHSEEEHQAVKTKLASKSVPTKQEVRDYIVANRDVPIQPRTSSQNLRIQAEKDQGRDLLSPKSGKTAQTGKTYDWQDLDMENVPLVQEENDPEPAQMQVQQHAEQPDCGQSYDGSQVTEEIDFNVGFGVRQRGGGEPSRNGGGVELQDNPDPDLPQTSKLRRHPAFSLRGKHHVSLNEHHKGFSLTRSNKRQAIARDWSPGRKWFVASVACFSTALIGILVGIYAGETPAIQYYIVDFHHYTVLGNVFFFIGLSIPTFIFWPLPLLHGRKPYILGSMSIAMPLLFPQALAVGTFRSPYVSTYRVGLILSRAVMGFALGFANMNFKGMLTDLFGASLQSMHPHQEHVDEFDVRRHGGGMGVWLGLWTWSALGSIGLGFLIGAVIINHLPPAWGFYVSICIIAFVMLLNVLCPEVRRSAFRRSVAEVVNGQEVSRRLARGEVKMHMVQSGPKWWGEEFHYGVMLTLKMLRQPGFMVMAVYVAWIYGQMVLNILLLGALMSKNYKFTSPRVGASVMAIPIGAFCSIPFQKAGLFSRSRRSGPPNDDQTFQKKTSWTSHMVRRAIFILVLPFAGIGYALSASGPPVPFIIPILLAGLIGFLSNLAMAECHGIIMETFDTSDLQPGMTGRPRGSSGDKTANKRTNYSSFPRVCSAFGITQGLGYLIAAAASGVGGVLSRHLGQQAACGVMAGILLILSLLLLGTLVRFTEVQIIPDSKKEEMDRYHNARRASQLRAQTGLEEDEPWRPVIIGNPHHHTRRMCLLELGSMSRFSEIRKKNKLVDEKSLEAKHPNRAALEALETKLKEKEAEVVAHVRRSLSLSRASSRASRRSKLGAVPEQGDLGGHREMLDSRGGSGRSGKGSGRGKGSKGRNLSRVQDAG